ncbi:MAG: ATP-dependent DNA helicase RecG [Oscillospiraceae bacterium]|jgi:ATP-dependent DNA helicase RecG|nr:ATP-dependent DNA helicase RecG [Oscillospiraceae bacterium]
MVNLYKSIGKLKGVGVKRKQLYEKLGILTAYDLICHFPRSYLDFSKTVPVHSAEPESVCVIKGRVTEKFMPYAAKSGRKVFTASAYDGTDGFIVTFFNNPYAFDSLLIGTEYYFYGKISSFNNSPQIVSPQIMPCGSDELLRAVYPLTEGLTNAMIQTNVRDVLAMPELADVEFLPYEFIDKYGLLPLADALRSVHFPKLAASSALQTPKESETVRKNEMRAPMTLSEFSDINMGGDDTSAAQQAVKPARYRLAFDELLVFQLGLLMLKQRNQQQTAYAMTEQGIEKYVNSLPFTLTQAQERAIREIYSAMGQNVPMNRLLQGDVGSGKTAVAAAACYLAFLNGSQSALMAPTEILAAQHYETLCSFLEPLGMTVAYLSGSLTPKQKTLVREEILYGKADFVIGTHALFQKDTVFRNLSLVITDEQHRFGVGQRAMLASKGNSPHKLVMSATPIPRTLGLIIYGELDISVLDELPKGRRKVETYGISARSRGRVYAFIRQQLSAGYGAYIVCPAIDAADFGMESVSVYAKRIEKEAFKGFNVGVLHGKMSGADKDEAMRRFRDKEINVLVATTVIEVGIDISHATVMMIENAERFGFSQLHQLRGRIGRGAQQGYCILVTECFNDDIREKFSIMVETSDGFKIAEEDLRLRGAGEFFGKKQHGLPGFKIADISSDLALVNLTRTAAEELIESDPFLTEEKHSALRGKVLELFENGWDGK